MDELRAHLLLTVADQKVGPFQLPRWERVSMGRTAGYGLHVPRSWVPSKLCRFIPWDEGWMVQVGPRTRMRVQDMYVGDHVFDRRSMVVLQPGNAVLSFPELDDWCQARVRIEVTDKVAPEVHDERVEDEPALRTRYAAGGLDVTETQREAVAATFAYLVTGTDKPTNLVKAAAEVLGRSPQGVTNSLNQVRSAINKERWGPKLESFEQLGHYLVHLTRSLTWEDLPDQLRRG